jgi:hypothetical protein
MTTDGKCRSRSEFSGWMPRAGMAQKLAPNFSFKHGRQQSTKSSYRPVGIMKHREFAPDLDDWIVRDGSTQDL